MHRRGGPGADDLPLRFAVAKLSLRRDADLEPLRALADELPGSAALEAALRPEAAP